MQFDKVAGDIGYHDDSHSYVNRKNSKKYISVTTLIHKFVPEFKADYWSLYKALKDTLSQGGQFSDLKRTAGGWESVVPYFKANYQMAVPNPAIRKLIGERKQWYLDKWEKDRDNACELGSAIHNELEGAAHTAQQIEDTKIKYDVSQENILALQDFSTNRVYPELLMYNDEYLIAGQADKVFKQGNKVDVHDYKTCKKIETEGFRGETLLEPFLDIPNANYWIYEIQLSMYGWMLEQCGYEVRNLYMHWIYGDNPETSNIRDKVKTFTMNYRPDVVKAMAITNTF